MTCIHWPIAFGGTNVGVMVKPWSKADQEGRGAATKRPFHNVASGTVAATSFYNAASFSRAFNGDAAGGASGSGGAAAPGALEARLNGTDAALKAITDRMDKNEAEARHKIVEQDTNMKAGFENVKNDMEASVAGMQVAVQASFSDLFAKLPRTSATVWMCRASVLRPMKPNLLKTQIGHTNMG